MTSWLGAHPNLQSQSPRLRLVIPRAAVRRVLQQVAHPQPRKYAVFILARGMALRAFSF